jgi:hypothetical protein
MSMTSENGPRNNDPERELRDEFARLRDEERRQVTPFREVLSKPIEHRPPPARASWVRITAAAAVLALIVGLTISRARWTPSQGPIAGTGAAIEIVDLGTTSWISPTDFLLELPSQELLEEVPTFGRTGDLIGEDRERPFDDPIERRNRT